MNLKESEIKMNLKEYVKRVYQLEKTLYNQNAFYQTLNQKRNDLINLKDKPMLPKASLDISDRGGSCILLGVVLGLLIGVFVGLFYSPSKETWDELVSIVKYGIIMGLIFGLVTFVLVLIASAGSTAMKNQEIRQKNDEIITINFNNRNKANWQIQMLEREMNVISAAYQDASDILQTYYNKNIIYKKYRNLIAVSSIYEYLESGRCSGLEGHEGAYNIFENEIRQNIIINRLDEVIRCLNKIADNQYMLYSAIQESNKKISRLSNELSRMADNLSAIEDNTAIMSYNTQLIAQNTELTNWLQVFNT